MRLLPDGQLPAAIFGLEYSSEYFTKRTFRGAFFVRIKREFLL